MIGDYLSIGPIWAICLEGDYSFSREGDRVHGAGNREGLYA